MLKTYEIMKIRRQALGLTREELAERTNLKVKEIEYYEDGMRMAGYVGAIINTTLRELFKNMDSITHYKRRILELAMEINADDEVDFMLRNIGHMITELGKLQMETMNDIIS